MIEEGWLEELKRKVDLAELGRRYGVQWDTRGRDPKACCPFHDEKTPSFHILGDPRRGVPRFVCYGACGRSWSAVSFLVDAHHRPFLEAVEELAALAGIAVPRGLDTTAARAEREQRRERREQTLAAVEVAQQFFSAYLREGESLHADTAREYVAARGLGAAVEGWGLGCAPPGHYLLDHLAEYQVAPEVADAAGLTARSDDGRRYAFLRKRLTLPWRDRSGRVLAHVGRAYAPDVAPKYLHPGEIPGVFVKGELVYGIHEAADHIHRAREAWVVEGQLSCLTPHLYGIRNVVACGGKAFSAAHARTLVGAGAERLVFVLDGDPAGRSGAAQAVRVAQAEKVPCQVLDLPAGLDPDDWFHVDELPA
ncbi:MAG: toprim domain-containing protein [Deltaproteobacteria bacterium]|nr:toprim domain-containing protein [Deltaproteobacteria bacterium]